MDSHPGLLLGISHARTDPMHEENCEVTPQTRTIKIYGTYTQCWPYVLHSLPKILLFLWISSYFFRQLKCYSGWKTDKHENEKLGCAINGQMPLGPSKVTFTAIHDQTWLRECNSTGGEVTVVLQCSRCQNVFKGHIEIRKLSCCNNYTAHTKMKLCVGLFYNCIGPKKCQQLWRQLL
jgi:hypothetical protein